MIKLVKEYVEKDLALKAVQKKLEKVWSLGQRGDFGNSESESPSEAFVKVGDKTYHVQGFSYKEVLIAPEVLE